MLIPDSVMEIEDTEPPNASKDSENCNLVNLLTQLSVKIEETNTSANSPKGFDPSKIRAGDGSYYIRQILEKLIGVEKLDIDEPSSSITSPRKLNEERSHII